jgi:hypothetical protein
MSAQFILNCETVGKFLSTPEPYCSHLYNGRIHLPIRAIAGTELGEARREKGWHRAGVWHLVPQF